MSVKKKVKVNETKRRGMAQVMRRHGPPPPTARNYARATFKQRKLREEQGGAFQGNTRAVDTPRIGVYHFGLPPLPHPLPRGAYVVDGGGSYAVSLARGGEYLGMFRRGT